MEGDLKVRVRGDGSPPFFMLIHGMASSGRIWLKMLESSDLAAVRGTFVMPDLPGMGESALEPGITYGDWIESLKRASPHRVHLVGHSLGGALAVSLAGEEWVESVALVAPATRRFCAEMRRVCRPGKSPGTILMRRAPGSLAHDPLRLSREDAAVLREDHERASLLLEEGLPWPCSLERESAQLNGKRALVVWGEEDKVVPARYVHELVQDLVAAGVTVEVAPIPGCGHVPMLEYPEETARILQGFWNR